MFERHRELSLTDRYREVAKALGYERMDEGVHERDFPKILRPSRLVIVAKYLEHVPSKEALDTIERKLYAFLWKVPDEIHRQVMRLLRTEFEGKDLDRSFDLEIAFWTRDLFAELARSPA